MKMSKIARATTALAAFALLAACGGGGAQSGGGSGNSDEPIKIGAMLPLSGSAAPFGRMYKQAGEYWASQHKTLLGRPVEVIFADAQGTTVGATKAARKLIQQENVDFLVGPILSNPTSGVLPTANQSETIEVVLGAYPPAANGSKFPYSFKIEYQIDVYTPALLQRLEQQGLTKLGLLVTDNALGEETVNAVRHAIEESGSPVQLAAVQRYASGSTNVSAQARKLVGSGVQAVRLAAVGPSDYISAINALVHAGYEGPIFGNSAIAVPPVVEALPEGVTARIRATGYTPSVLRGTMSEEVKEFRTGLKNFLGTQALSIKLYNTATSYDAFNMIYTAVKESGSMDPDTIASYLEQNGYEGLKADYEFSNTNHQGLKTDDVAFGVPGTVKDGALLNAACQNDNAGRCDAPQ